MKKNSDAIYEIILAVLIIALMLLPQLIGTTSVADDLKDAYRPGGARDEIRDADHP